MKIAVITLGCPKNLVDTEVMLGLLDEAGYRFVSDPQQADVAIVSTCSFISAAVAESLDVVRECIALKASGGPARVVVAGCLPQRFGASTGSMLPGVDGVVGCSEFENIVKVVEDVAAGIDVFRVSDPTALYDETSPRVLGTPGHVAYVKIADGCDNCCTYCTIPSIRGRLRSRNPDSVVAEVEALVRIGVSEINLIAQDTTAYGTDIASNVTLSSLVAMLSGTGIPWIRLLYTHPAHVTDDLLSVMGEGGSVVPYLDMPIQHVSDRVLRDMGRKTDGSTIRRILSRARDMVPDVAIRSSVMTGFPGETEAEFDELLSFVADGFIDHLGVFEYSPEPGTPACSMEGLVDAETTGDRARLLVETMLELTERRGAGLVGRELTVLVDSTAGEGSGLATGRTAGHAWETDGEVRLSVECEGVTPGAFVRAEITAADGFDLEGRVLRREERLSERGETA